MKIFTSKETVRQAIESDAQVIFEAEQFWAKATGRLVSTADELRLELFTRLINRSYNARNDRFLVLERKNKVVGHAFIEGLHGYALRHIGYLTIVIHPNHTGKGYGTILIKSLIKWATQESDLRKIELLVRSTNTEAHKLYSRLGFQQEGRFIKRLQISDGVFIDDILMGLWLAK